MQGGSNDSGDESHSKNPLSIAVEDGNAKRKGPPGPPPRPGRAPHGGAATPSNPEGGLSVPAAVSSDEVAPPLKAADDAATKGPSADADNKADSDKPLSSARSFMLKKDTAAKDKAAETEKAMAQDDDDSDDESDDGERKLNPCVQLMYTIATNQFFSGFMMLVTLFALFGDGKRAACRKRRACTIVCARSTVC